jgi:hypothetical protein
MSRLLTVLIILAFVPACTATIEPPKAKIVIPAGSIDNDASFCPPGQAKKGRC